jgi:hypothetical protein
MMIGRLENLVEDWREQERVKTRRLDVAGKLVLVFAVCAILGVILFLLAGRAGADEITVGGRTEDAHCFVEYTLPERTVCVSESFVCTTIEDLAQTVCLVKR